MKTRINCITLAVDQLEKSLVFYRDGLGLPTKDVADATDHLALELPGDLYLVLLLREEFSEFAKLANQQEVLRGMSECILSYFAASKEEVDAILTRVEAAGGEIPSQAKEHPWGYAGYFTDPDGHLWEVMWNSKLKRKS